MEIELNDLRDWCYIDLTARDASCEDHEVIQSPCFQGWL